MSRAALFALALAVACTTACDEERPPAPVSPFRDSGVDCGLMYMPEPASGDVDGDGTPDSMDTDADGDGIENRWEHSGGPMCLGPDADGDGIPNWLDVDSDSDGVLDSEENTQRTNAYGRDTDGDGWSDLIELHGSHTDPLSDSSEPRESDVAIVLDYMAAPATRPLRFQNIVETADVFFLVDTTGTMSGERQELIEGLTTVIIPGLLGAINDFYLGVGGFADYPVGVYGDTGDRPFFLLSRMIPGDLDESHWSAASSCEPAFGTFAPGANEIPDVQDAAEGLPCMNGSDFPEATVAALWAVATGGSLSWSGGSLPAQSCPAEPGEMPRRGYPCFRADALPIVILFSDDLWHNGPMGAEPYDASLDAPTYDEMIAAVGALGARVITVYSGVDMLPEEIAAERPLFEGLATATGAVAADGSPMVLDIQADGSGIDAAVVNAVTQLAAGVIQDISTRVESASDNPDGVDATTLVEGVRAVDCTLGATSGPMEGVTYTSKTETTFVGVMPSVTCQFDLTLRNATLVPADTARVFRLRVVAVGDGVSAFARRDVYIVVPGQGGAVQL